MTSSTVIPVANPTHAVLTPAAVVADSHVDAQTNESILHSLLDRMGTYDRDRRGAMTPEEIRADNDQLVAKEISFRARRAAEDVERDSRKAERKAKLALLTPVERVMEESGFNDMSIARFLKTDCGQQWIEKGNAMPVERAPTVESRLAELVEVVRTIANRSIVHEAPEPSMTLEEFSESDWSHGGRYINGYNVEIFHTGEWSRSGWRVYLINYTTGRASRYGLGNWSQEDAKAIAYNLVFPNS